MDKKFCGSCQTFRPVEEMKLIDTANKGVKRWKCNSCMNKLSTRKYQGKNYEKTI